MCLLYAVETSAHIQGAVTWHLEAVSHYLRLDNIRYHAGCISAVAPVAAWLGGYSGQNYVQAEQNNKQSAQEREETHLLLSFIMDWE